MGQSRMDNPEKLATYLRIVVSYIVLCFVFLCLVYPKLPVFWIVHFNCPFGILEHLFIKYYFIIVNREENVNRKWTIYLTQLCTPAIWPLSQRKLVCKAYRGEIRYISSILFMLNVIKNFPHRQSRIDNFPCVLSVNICKDNYILCCVIVVLCVVFGRQVLVFLYFFPLPL